MIKKNVLFVALIAILIGVDCLVVSGDPNETEEICENTCASAYDGECDDGGPGSTTFV